MSTLELMPRYSRLMIDLQHQIAGMDIGDRLPPERQLAQSLNVSRQTLRRAVRVLVEQDILESRQGSGTYVCAKIPTPDQSGHSLPLGGVQQSQQSLKLIGLSVPTVEVPQIARVANGAEIACQELGYRLILTHDHGNPQQQVDQLRDLFNSQIDGILVFLDQDNVTRPECIELLKQGIEDGVKVVLLDRYIPGVDYPCVLTDVVDGMYTATQHMLMLGCRRPAVISWGKQAGIAERNRFAGFRNAMKDHDLDPTPVLHGEVGYGQCQETSARRIVNDWLKAHDNRLPCDGIICFVDDMAHGAYWALREAGISVPDDVALIGFDNARPMLDPGKQIGLTTIDQPLNDLGKQAVGRLIELLKDANPDDPLKHTFLKPKLIVRESCGS